MKKVLIFLAVFISLVVIAIRLLTIPIGRYLGVEQKAGIRVLSEPQSAQVFIDGVDLGKTPFENQELEAKDYLVKLQNGSASWEGKVSLRGGTLTVVNRELSAQIAFSAGEMLSLTGGKGVTVISKPNDAEVEVDGKSYGKTPISINVGAGEHTFNISHQNFLNRSVRAYVPADYNLNISVDLAISEADLAQVNTPPIVSVQEVKILNTPTGYLRVRDKASLNGAEIGRVVPGDKLTLLEDQISWFKVKLANGKEGFISSSYAQKLNP